MKRKLKKTRQFAFNVLVEDNKYIVYRDADNTYFETVVYYFEIKIEIQQTKAIPGPVVLLEKRIANFFFKELFWLITSTIINLI